MLRRRIGYGLCLGATLLFQILDMGYLAHFLFGTALALPLLSLLLSLPSLLSCRVQLHAVPASVSRGGEAMWRLEVQGYAWLPAPRLSLRLEFNNTLTGARMPYRITLSGALQGHALEVRADTAHCGRLVCRVRRGKVCDYLGLFSLTLRRPAKESLLCLPVPDPRPLPKGFPAGEDSDRRLVPRPGGGPGEDYDLRPYRAGDSLRSIHWKLSSKREELVVRETLEPQQPHVVLTLDHFGTPEEMDAALDRLDSFCRTLLEEQTAHLVAWTHPVSGQVRRHSVADRQELVTCLAALLDDPAPSRGRSILDCPTAFPSLGTGRHIHIRPGGEVVL